MIFATKMLPITIANLIFNTNPFWITILGYFVLKEKIGIMDFVGLIGSFIGVLIIIFDKEEDKSESKSQVNTAGVIVAIIWSMSVAGVAISTRKLKSLHFSMVVFIYSGGATLAYFLYLVFEYCFL